MTGGILETLTSAFDLWGFTDEEPYDEEPSAENISLPEDNRLITPSLRQELQQQIFGKPPATPVESLDSVQTELCTLVEDLLLHPFLLAKLASANGREKLQTYATRLQNDLGLKRQVAQSILKLFDGPLKEAIGSRLKGNWARYKAITTPIDPRFVQMGKRIWKGSDRLDEERAFYRLLDEAPEGCQRTLQTAWKALYSENEQEAKDNLTTTLSFARGAKAFFSLLEQEAPIEGDLPSFLTRIRQQKDGHGIGEALADTALLLADQLSRPFAHLHDQIDPESAEVIQLITQALSEEIASRLFASESRTAALLMKTEMSLLCGLMINRMQSVLRGYVQNFARLIETNGKVSSEELLQALRDEENLDERLHPAIPVSNDPSVINEWDHKFSERTVMPVIEKIFCPNGIVSELLAPIAGKSDVKLRPLKTLVESLEKMIRAQGVQGIKEQIQQLSDPLKMNEGLINGVETLFDWWADDWPYIQDLEKEYRLECKKLKRVNLETNYHHAQLALQTIVAIYVWTNKPGVVPVMQGAACHLHSLLQDPQLIKNLLFHLIDTALFSFIRSLRDLDAAKIHTLMGERVKSQEELEQAAEPFNDEAMEELTDLLFYVAQVGTKHMPGHSKWKDSLAAWFGRRAMKLAKKRVKGLVRSFAHWVVPVKGEVTAGRVVTGIQSSADSWLKSGALETLIRGQMKGKMN